MWVPGQRAKDMRLLMAIPELELNAGARQQLTWSAIATLLIIALSMPLTWVLAGLAGLLSQGWLLYHLWRVAHLYWRHLKVIQLGKAAA